MRDEISVFDWYGDGGDLPSADEVLDVGSWPASEGTRRSLAREIFGMAIVNEYDSTVRIANKAIFEGERLKAPPPQLAEGYALIGRMPETDRRVMLNLIAYYIHLSFYGFMCFLDGASGYFVHDGYCEHVKCSVNMYKRDATRHILDNPGDEVEVFDIEDEHLSFYESYHAWMGRYSRTKELTRPLGE